MKTKKNETNVFNIFFPYGISKCKKIGLWHFINREYNPIGLSGDDDHYKQRMESYCAIRLKGLTDNRILKIVEKHNIRIRENDEAIFYSDATKPTKTKDYSKYFQILKAFSNFTFRW